MEYPVWYVPFITAPMLIPAVAIPHVIVAQFAVGFGIMVTAMLYCAYKENLVAVRACLKDVARAFILISLVFGAVTGVGIWWTIGLTSPETTSALIHIFVFGWATEWVMFVVEIVSAFVFYYFWDRLAPRQHVIMGIIYAVSAWLSLVVISAVLAFMVTSGGWKPGDGFFRAVLNPSFLPQVLLRTGGALAMTSLAIAAIVSFSRHENAAKDRIMRWVSQWALGGMALIMVGGAAYFFTLPDYVRLNLIRAPILLIMLVLNFGVTAVAIGAFSLGYLSGARWINPPSACLLMVVGMLAIASGEFVREGGRKPYRIDGLMLSPGVRAADVAKFQKEGLIANSRWLRSYLESAIPGFDAAHISSLPVEQQKVAGHAIFQYHCASCHAQFGYNGIIPLLKPWNEEYTRKAIHSLHLANPAMPPWLGTAVEKEALLAYLLPFTTHATQGDKK